MLFDEIQSYILFFVLFWGLFLHYVNHIKSVYSSGLQLKRMFYFQHPQKLCPHTKQAGQNPKHQELQYSGDLGSHMAKLIRIV